MLLNIKRKNQEWFESKKLLKVGTPISTTSNKILKTQLSLA